MRLVAARLNRRVLIWLLLLAAAALAGCSSSDAVLPSGATDTPGASDWFAGGIVAYTAELKVASGVPQATVDACMVAIAYAMAYVLRFDPSIPHRYQVLLAESIGFVVVGKVAIFAIFRLYHRLWRFVERRHRRAE